MKNLVKKITGIALLIFFLGSTSYGQSDEKKYAASLIEFEENLTSKTFMKTWKKQKKAWEESCNSATTIKQLTDLTMKLATTCYQYKQVRPMLVNTETVYAQAEALLMLQNIMVDDVPKWTESAQKKWKAGLETLRKDIEEKERKKLILERQTNIAAVLKDFEEKFKLILEDSKKGSFANTIVPSKSENEYNVKIKFAEGINQKVLVDGDNIYRFFVDFPVNNDKEYAEELLAKMFVIIESNVPEGFESSIKYDKKYLNNQATNYEFKAESFNHTAKRPSILIGAMGDLTVIKLQIEEPVFKR